MGRRWFWVLKVVLEVGRGFLQAGQHGIAECAVSVIIFRGQIVV